jgi:hypothetical protein
MQNNIITETKEAQTHSKKAILKATGGALLAALIILFVVILPAEYGIDPTGLGNAIGFTALGKNKIARVSSGNHPEPMTYREDRITLTIQPRDGVEYKFKINEGSSMLYSWSADGELDYDFHGDTVGTENPDSTPVSYEKKIAEEAHGSFVTPFTGRYGWWWANYTDKPIQVTLETAGFYEIIGIPKKESLQ